MKKHLLFALLFGVSQIFAQGLIKQSSTLANDTLVGCGSYEYMLNQDQKTPGFLAGSNQFMKEMQDQLNHQAQKQTSADVLVVPVVFHLVYNNPDANLHDSVIQNQIDVLNASFRRTNADTASLRAPFKSLVGDARIEFVLADKDPQGNPTTGITRKQTSVTHFGGTLPYSPGQTQQINQWVEDSLFYNYFRITADSLGGTTPWDTSNYLNIWVGDLRIFEPNFGNFEELVLFGLATPPNNHQNWPTDIYGLPELQQGIIMHYPVIGNNNPNPFPNPYQAYNSLVKEGKMLVHEVGHYLGLRHIWGDGDCTQDDYVHDTPRSNASSLYDCNSSKNTCVDTILGQDLPDMIENYMDYSSDPCKNAFTNGQIAIMREVLENYRPNLYHIGLLENTPKLQMSYYPNPSQGKLNLNFNQVKSKVQINILSLDGKLLESRVFQNTSQIQLQLNLVNGMYLVQVLSEGASNSFKLVFQKV